MDGQHSSEDEKVVADAINSWDAQELFSQLLRSKNYKMNHRSRGRVIIFNHKYFDSRLRNYPSRKGTEVDVRNLKEALPKLGFRQSDINVYNDLTASDIFQTLKKVRREDHTDRDLLMVFVLTHGAKADRISAYDEDYSVEDIWQHFTADKCPSLAEKPKIFFIVACRGDYVDGGIRKFYVPDEHEVDSCRIDYPSYTIPVWSDFLCVFSTVKGYYSYRNVIDGTWYVGAFCDELKECESLGEVNFMDFLTAVNGRIAKLYEAGGMFEVKKQTPSLTSTLTKRLYFKTNHHA